MTSRRAAVIGGGFYGCILALYLKARGYGVTLYEREKQLMGRASYHNQARVHGGYHYPRSFTTARRSRVNLPRFLQEFPQVVHQQRSLYAIVRHRSLVTAQQFERFCRAIGAPLEDAPSELADLFTPHLIEAVYLVDEPTFNADLLRAWAELQVQQAGIEVRLNCPAERVERRATAPSFLITSPLGIDAFDLVIHATYSGLGQLTGSPPLLRPLKQELTEMALVQVPPALEGLGITVMDGPFFSLMPFPARNLHTLSHVRYTPQRSWLDSRAIDPHTALDSDPGISRFDWMRRDASRYVPVFAELKQQGSLFEIKTVPLKNEVDDGRPILLEEAANWPGFYSVLGGKIDNVFDVVEALDELIQH